LRACLAVRQEAQLVRPCGRYIKKFEQFFPPTPRLRRTRKRNSDKFAVAPTRPQTYLFKNRRAFQAISPASSASGAGKFFLRVSITRCQIFFKQGGLKKFDWRQILFV